MPNVKEIHFFDNDENYSQGLDYYESQVPGIGLGLLRGEISPRYMLYKECLKRIYKHYPSIRLIVSLRQPLERAFSQYKYFRYNKRKEPESDFVRALVGVYREDYLEKSLYSRQIQNILDIFPREHILILLDFEIRADPSAAYNRVLSFLGAKEPFEPVALHRSINSSQEQRIDPWPIWAWINRAQIQQTRLIGGQIYGTDTIGPIRALLLRNRISRGLVRRVNSFLDTMHGSGAEYELSPKKKHELFTIWFENDVNELEKLIKQDLSPWREFKER